LNLADALQSSGVEVVEVIALAEPERRPAFFNTDLGLSGVEYLIAETGSVVLATTPGQPRSLSLLPPMHVALAHRGQVLPDLFDLFETHLQARPEDMPSALLLITGPSKTGDIELKLVTGVHGPGEIHVIVVEELPPAGH
jgi:L-lactate dehydrogenase complex protein LldG